MRKQNSSAVRKRAIDALKTKTVLTVLGGRDLTNVVRLEDAVEIVKQAVAEMGGQS